MVTRRITIESNGRASAVMSFAYAKATPVTLRTCPSRPIAPASFAAYSSVIRTNYVSRFQKQRIEDIEERLVACGH
jgi:hypothetical protein